MQNLTNVQNKFWNKVKVLDETISEELSCWIWEPANWKFWIYNGSGGTIAPDRFSYEYFNGPLIDPTTRIIHKCNNKRCVNPDHLDPEIKFHVDMNIHNKMEYEQNVIDRFWNKVEYPGNDDDCWIWKAYKDRDGYGDFTIHLHLPRMMAHRFAFEYINGPIPENLFVCHKCDTPSCVNPNHLKLGTPDDNMQDCKNKGRRPKGSEHHSAKLTESDVEKIIVGTLNGVYSCYEDVMCEYPISKTSLSYIFNDKSWKHVMSKFSEHDIELARELLKNNSSLLPDQVRDIRIRLNNNETAYSIAKLYNVTNTMIHNIKIGKTYKHII